MVKEKYLEKIKEFGIDPNDLIKLDEKSFSYIFKTSEDKAKEILTDLLENWYKHSGFKTGLEIQEEANYLPSVFPTINQKMNGFKLGTLVQFYGPYASGKTNIMLTHVAEYLKLGIVYWIDSEQTFEIKRLKEIMKNRGIDEKFLENFKYLYAPNTNMMELGVFKFFEDALKQKAEGKNVIGLFIDSLLAPYRSEYIGVEELAVRQQRINWLLRHLLRFAEITKTIVMFSNQVVATIGKYTEFAPIGGHVTAHSSTYIFRITKAGKYRKMVAEDIPYTEQFVINFKISEKGVEEVEKLENSEQ